MRGAGRKTSRKVSLVVLLQARFRLPGKLAAPQQARKGRLCYRPGEVGLLIGKENSEQLVSGVSAQVPP